MTTYDRSEPADCAVVDRWPGGVGWQAHPEEGGCRTSHAVSGEGGVWVLDPLDAPGVEELLAELGEVAGVAVLSDYHARDAAAFADRYGVPVHVPAWFDRVEERVDAPVERFRDDLGASGFDVHRYAPVPGWRVGVAHREADGTLYVPDALGTAPRYTVGPERIGVFLLLRPFPPRELLGDCDPERVLVGHGTGVFEDAAAELAVALDGARRRFPAALRAHGVAQCRALLDALG